MRASENDLRTTSIRPDTPTRTAIGQDEPEPGQSSLLIFGTGLLRYRARIAKWMVAMGVLATIVALLRPSVYAATGSFIPQGAETGQSSLAMLAGQLGVTVPGGGQSLSPDFYVKLLRSRELLKTIVRDTLTVPEEGRKATVGELFGVGGDSPARREDAAIRRLTSAISASASRTTGIVEFEVETKWPSVSVAIADDLLKGVNEFNQQLRHEQASQERKFVESRLALAADDLRAAEQRMEDFSNSNKNLGSSAYLSLQRERLNRDIGLKQQVFTNLTAAYEDVRIREVRDTPVIMVIERPSTPANPEPSGKIWTIVLGILLGAFIGGVSALSSDSIARRRQAGDANADEFADTLGEIKGRMLGGIKRLRPRSKS